MSVGPTVGPVQRPGDDRDFTEIFQRLAALEAQPPGRWIYVGDYPGDPDTTPDSPPFLNGWSNVGGGSRRLRFRRTTEWSIEIEGDITGGSPETVVVNLSDFYRPPEDVPIVGTIEGVPAEWVYQASGNLVVGSASAACCDAADIPFTGSSLVPADDVQEAIDYLSEHSGGGAVASVSAADTSVVVTPTTGAVTVRTNTLDVIAADHPPAADWSNNSKKITSLANGSSAQDAAAFGQIPTSLPPSGSAGGVLDGSYPNPGLAAGVAGAGLAETSDVLSVNVDATSIVIAADTLAVGTIDGGSP